MSINFILTYTLAAIVFISNPHLAYGQSVGSNKMKMTIPLTAGSFEVKGKIKGYALLKGKSYKTSTLKIDCASLNSGIDLRDEHLKKYLKCDKQPIITMSKIKAFPGKGVGQGKLSAATVKDIRQPFDFEVKGKLFCAKFKVDTEKFGIKGINYKGVGVDRYVEIQGCIPLKKS